MTPLRHLALLLSTLCLAAQFSVAQSAVGSDAGDTLAITTTELVPVLTAVYFDSASARISSRYHLYSRPAETNAFDEEGLPVDGLEAHRSILDLIGSRLRRFPATTIEVEGRHSELSLRCESCETATERAIEVRRYLSEIWGIDTARIRTTRSRDSTLIIATLIQFKYDAPDPGPISDRIIRELIPHIGAGSRVHVSGHTDITGMEDRNRKLSEIRAEAVAAMIRKQIPSEKKVTITAIGLGETVALYDNMQPAGRNLGRCVGVKIIRPE